MIQENQNQGWTKKGQQQEPLMRVQSHSAGRELDAEVMASVFKREIKWWRNDPSYLGTEPGGWKTESTVPRFSTSLVDAMQVLDAWKGGWRSQRYPADRNFTVTLYSGPKDSTGISATHESFTVAICLAALRALDA